jgi:hypothetical protein
VRTRVEQVEKVASTQKVTRTHTIGKEGKREEKREGREQASVPLEKKR